MKKKLVQIRLVVFKENTKNAPLILKNNVTEPKARRLGYNSNYQLKSCQQVNGHFQISGNHCFWKLKLTYILLTVSLVIRVA